MISSSTISVIEVKLSLGSVGFGVIERTGRDNKDGSVVEAFSTIL